MKSNVVITPLKLQQNEIHSVQPSISHSSCTVCGRLNNSGEQRVFQGPNNNDRETVIISQEHDEILPYLTSSHRIIGFIPIVSQFASIFYLIAFKKDMAKIMQVLFAQGFIDFWKSLFIMCQSPKKLIMRRPKMVPPQQSQKSPIATNASHSKLQSCLLQPTTMDPSSWMTPLQDRKLCDLCLPATHNSHAYVCQPTPFGTDWVLCQQMTIKEQLEAGIRLLDLRVSSKTYFGHGPALTERIDVVVRDICDFLSKHPHQVVVCLVRANSKTTPEIKNQNVVQLIHDALQKQLDTLSVKLPCQCTTDNCYEDATTGSAASVTTARVTASASTKENEQINIHVPKTLTDANNLKQKTLQEINYANNSSSHRVSSLILEPASFWQGSWGQTRSNIVSKVVEECFKWAIPVNNELDATTSNLSAGSSTRTARTAMSSSKKHRLMELICTVDAGTTSKTIEVAILHSVKSLNRKLRDEIKRNGNALLRPPVLCHLQGLMLDYPTKHEIQSVITYNHQHC